MSVARDLTGMDGTPRWLRHETFPGGIAARAGRAHRRAVVSETSRSCKYRATDAVVEVPPMNRIGMYLRALERTDPWLEGDVTEAFDLMSLGGGEPRRSEYTGIKALMVAMLEDAIQCYVSPSGRMRADAEYWIKSSNHRLAFSFCVVCETLGLDPDAVRRVIQRLPRRDDRRQASPPAKPPERPSRRRNGSRGGDPPSAAATLGLAPNPKMTDESTVDSSQSRVAVRVDEEACRNATAVQLRLAMACHPMLPSRLSLSSAAGFGLGLRHDPDGRGTTGHCRSPCSSLCRGT